MQRQRRVRVDALPVVFDKPGMRPGKKCSGSGQIAPVRWTDLFAVIRAKQPLVHLLGRGTRAEPAHHISVIGSEASSFIDPPSTGVTRCQIQCLAASLVEISAGPCSQSPGKALLPQFRDSVYAT